MTCCSGPLATIRIPWRWRQSRAALPPRACRVKCAVARPWRQCARWWTGPHAQRVDVAARIDGAFAHRLFWRHVLRSAETQARLRHALAARALHSQCNPKVGDECRAIVQKNVLGLDVAMDHVLSMCVVEREVHRGHAADAEFALEAVAVGERGGEACHDVGHGIRSNAAATASHAVMRSVTMRASTSNSPSYSL